MFSSLSGPEILIILVLALLLFGPRRLPQMGRTIGKALSEFRRATTDFKMNLEREVDTAEFREATQDLRDAADEVKSVARGQLLEDPPRSAKAPAEPAAETETPTSEPDAPERT